VSIGERSKSNSDTYVKEKKKSKEIKRKYGIKQEK
jgi:hypothetical protein